MPIYEYRCGDCGRRVTLFFKRMGAEEAKRCPRCGSEKLTRLISRFALGHTDEDRLERLADPAALAGLDENDPKSVAQYMRRMGKELGEEAGEDFEQAVAELEGGKLDADSETPVGDVGDTSAPAE